MRSERGQTAAEYVGVLLVVATIIAAAGTSHAGDALRGAVADKVCAIAHGRTSCHGSRPRAGGPARALMATTATTAAKPSKSVGARRVARANRAARRAILKALLHPWGKPLARADKALAAYDQTLRYCTNGDRRPPTVGCPGLTTKDTNVWRLRRLYDVAHSIHDVLGTIWDALTGQRPPTQAEIDASVAEFIVNAAQLAGFRTREDLDQFIKAHRQDIVDGYNAVARGETNYTGGQYIARGARDPDLRQTIKQLYRKTAKVGDGGTADKLISEVKAGCRGAGCEHWIKANERRRNLITILSKDTLTADDRKIAGELLGALNKAIAKAKGPP